MIRALIARLHDWGGKQIEQVAHPEWMRQDLELIDELDVNPKRKQWLRNRVLNGSRLWNVMAEDWEDLP